MALTIVYAVDSQQLQSVRMLFQEYADSLGIDLGFWYCPGTVPGFQHFANELAELPGKFAPPAGCLLLALVDDQALRRLADGVCEMKRLYVRPAYRKSGLGRTLAVQVIQEARRLGYERMRLDTIAPLMDRAVALYRSLGFENIPPYCDNPYPGAQFMELRMAAGESATRLAGNHLGGS